MENAAVGVAEVEMVGASGSLAPPWNRWVRRPDFSDWNASVA